MSLINNFQIPNTSSNKYNKDKRRFQEIMHNRLVQSAQLQNIHPSSADDIEDDIEDEEEEEEEEEDDDMLE